MQATLEPSGGQCNVYSESGNTYTVDIVEGTCICADYRQNDSKNGCKHRCRVEMEIRAKRVPTPDGRIPERVASDGGVTAESQVQDRNAIDRFAVQSLNSTPMVSGLARSITAVEPVAPKRCENET